VAERSIADQVAEQLSPFLGEFNAKIAVKTFAQRTLKVAPEAISLGDLPALLDALRPMLHTFVGQASADALLDRIRRGVN